jgi:phosphoglycerate dehydrogenase-like enzyme
MPLSLLWTSQLGADHLDPATFSTDVELRLATDPEDAERDADWAEVVVGAHPSERLLDGARLRHVVVPFAGIDATLTTRILQRPHLSLHNSHANADYVAQHALALLLACSNRIAIYDRALRRGDWGDRHRPGAASLLLAGRRCLLIGYGAIGRALRPMLEALGMEIAVVRRGPAIAGDPPTVGSDRLHEALGDADAVIVSLPATEETEQLIDADALAALPEHALLVNVGRGSVIDPEALYRALRDGALAGAGLDVWWRYPERERASAAFQPLPFHTLPTVVASPHRANHVADWHLDSFLDVARTVDALARGESRNRVDLERGY